ncbi:MAG: D-alanine--D-alanine ligase, partial [Oscillospiraceae bacterium]|nr:D-alanine--D-alanine ligase [Oscillospiraceae bacterium]
FLALHGDIGENGKLQAIFDAFGILYTGTGYIGSLLAMDKNLSKTLMRSRGILTPDWKILGANTEFEPEFPCVIKPVSCGSSVGVSIVKNKAQYAAALNYAQKYEKKIMVEEMIPGREFSVGILDGTALPAIEIMPSDGFYDYKNKYQIGLTREVCPADLPSETAEKLGDIALCVHKTLQLGSYSRVDFILSDKTGELYCLEANTLPGMTPTSLLPQEALAAGLSYVGLCDKIVKMAIENRGDHG